jgi:uncharacterized membrane protein required for colicin V production
MNIADITILIIIIGAGILGYTKGFLQQILSFVFFLLTLGLTYYIQGILYHWVVGTDIFTWLVSFIQTQMIPNNGLFTQILDVSNFTDLISSGLAALPIPASIYEPFFLSINDFFNTSLGEFLAVGLTRLTISALSYLLPFVVLWMVFRLIETLIHRFVQSIKIVSISNRILGFLFGLIQGGVLVSVVLLPLILISFVSNDLSSFLTSWLGLTREGFAVGKFIYEILLSIIA